ncbi:Nnf1-domain-containing protein [Dipodascopsis tothii]|uniref:Nnf1-domain-containing protein n=1 Tax=Dipodascopsis tothii TaxID=44089 RepID=UPI0034CE4C48
MESENVQTSVRYQRLREVFEKSLKMSTDAVSFEKLSECYPHTSTHGRAGLQEAFKQATSYWDTSAKREFETILIERDAKSKLILLDGLIKEACERKKGGAEKQVFLEKLTPDDIVQAHLKAVKYSEAEYLEQQVCKIQSTNRQLLQELSLQELKINESFTDLNKVIRDLSTAVDELREMLPENELIRSIDQISSQVVMS